MGKRDNVAKALDRAHAASDAIADFEIDASTARLIIFSDLHKGTRDGADDFRKCEPAFHAAMAHYAALGYTLVELGDIEELWESRPRKVIEHYRHTLELVAPFHSAERYYRVYGNHDDDWATDAQVQKHLGQFFPEPRLRVWEGLRIAVLDGQRRLGELFLAHGHQGSSFSDRHRKFSRWIVRNIWRPVQRLTGISFTTPAKSWELAAEHDVNMYLWAAGKPRLVLIAGHTHHPVFCGRSFAEDIAEDLKEAESRLAHSPGDPDLEEKVRGLRVRHEWVKARQPGGTKRGKDGDHGKRPCYFNTGCCSFPDGNITGIEVSDGKIRLIRWRGDTRLPAREVLRENTLEDVYESLSTTQPS